MIAKAGTHQVTAPGELRGRALGISLWLFAGSGPVSSMVFGALTDAVGVTPTVAIGGLGCLLAGTAFAVALAVQRRWQ